MRVINAINYYRANGLLGTLHKALVYPVQRLRRKAQRQSLAGQSPREVFRRIYDENIWGNMASRSGNGSTLSATRALRTALPQLFTIYHVRTFLDAPCGDFAWMKAVPLPTDMQYIGADIVPDLIAKIETDYGNAQRKFMVLDIITTPLPKADMMMCRDCLFHLSYRDIAGFLYNFVASGIPYLLTTSHVDVTSNRDINTGDFRPIDLFSKPFCFPRETLFEVSDHFAGTTPRKMYLWSREQIAEAVHASKRLARQL
jgi:hypothetical protein